MADIFISYSSNDREKAEQLTELLLSAGLSVWIDRQGIEAASSWSEEIVDGIDNCKMFVILLSASSIESHNVIKEVSLASEKRKKILPLDIEPVEIPKSMQYALAGLQRTPMTNIDAIIRAIGKLGLEATQAPTLKLVKETDSRKSLMILPFEDLSPTGDNGWFSDGIVSELIGTLSNIKSLRLMNQQETKSFKNFKGHLTEFARTMDVRYFVQGSVRKFGDQIKVMSQLLDIQNGEYLWQDTHKGTMSDIFEIQEAVAQKVVEGLTLYLTSDEKKKLAARGTENAEAYELYMKASEYFLRQTKEGYKLSAQLLTEAIRLDPGYGRAYSLKATILTILYRTYDRTAALLDEAETLCKEALRLSPDLFAAYSPLSAIYLQRGQLTQAEEMATEYIRKDPQNFQSYVALAFFYWSTGQYAKAIAPCEESVRLQPDDLPSMVNLVVLCHIAGDAEKSAYWATLALPYYERYLKLHPEDETMREVYASLLFFSGRTSDAHAAAMKLTDLKDGNTLYNLATLFSRLVDYPEALRSFRKAIEVGFRDIRLLKEFLTDEKEGVAALAGTPEYEEVKRMVEKIEAEANTRG